MQKRYKIYSNKPADNISSCDGCENDKKAEEQSVCC